MEQRLRLPSVSTDKVFYFTGNPVLPGQAEQGICGAPGGRKDASPPLVLLQVVTGEGDRQAFGLAHHEPKQLLLLGGEVGKAVQPYLLALRPPAGPQLVRRPGQPVPGVQGGLVCQSLVLPQDQAQVLELVPLRTGGRPPRLDKQLWRDAAAFQLVRRGQQRGEEGGPLGGPPVDFQLSGGVPNCPIHQKEPSAAIQLLLPQAPRLLKNPVGQPAEGQHLRPQIDLRPPGGAQRPLRLVGLLLRDQKYLGPRPLRLTYAVQHGGGLSAPRAA